MNDILIRKATKEDAIGKGYVHYQSWIDTYSNHFSSEVMNRHSLEWCVDMAEKHPENTYVAIIDNRVVGFVGYMKSRDEDLKDTGEIVAIYLLKEYHKQGIGKQLLDVALNELQHFSRVSLWVLQNNDKALEFYTKNGFSPDGKTKVLFENVVIRMIKIQLRHYLKG